MKFSPEVQKVIDSYKKSDFKYKDNLQEFSFYHNDSTYSLIKRFFMLKAMSSNFFINRSLGLMNFSYKILGTSLSNAFLNRTICPMVCSGETITDLLVDILHYKDKNIGSISGYTIEALTEMNEAHIDDSLKVMMDTMVAQNLIGNDMYALKYTSMLTGEMMTKFSKA